MANLINSDRELRIGEFVQDGRSDAEVRDKRRGEIQIEYADGDRIWLQKNRFRHNGDHWKVV